MAAAEATAALAAETSGASEAEHSALQQRCKDLEKKFAVARKKIQVGGQEDWQVHAWRGQHSDHEVLALHGYSKWLQQGVVRACLSLACMQACWQRLLPSVARPHLIACIILVKQQRHTLFNWQPAFRALLVHRTHKPWCSAC